MQYEKKLTPLMSQWSECKERAKEALLLFRLGDFYEAFYEDAEVVSRELDLILTKRQEVPMSGIPWHTAENYIDKLVEKGYKVAVAEQMEDPKLAKGLVKREVVRIITRGTLINSSLLSEKSNNFIASIYQLGKVFGLALIDLSTAEFRVTECEKEDELISEINRISPKECLTTEKIKEKLSALTTANELRIVAREESFFDHSWSYQRLLKQFNLHTLDGFGMKGMVAAITAAGALLCYLEEEINFPLTYLRKITPYSLRHFLAVDATTARHLELTQSSGEKGKGTLLSIIDKTLTPMGGRLISSWVTHPLYSLLEIKERQEAIATLLETPHLLSTLRRHLKEIRDIERLLMKISLLSATPKDLVALRSSLEAIAPIKKLLSPLVSPLLSHANEKMIEMREVIELLKRALLDDPAVRLGEGEVFRSGYNTELDQINQLSQGGKEWLVGYQAKLQSETGIKTLKISFNRVFGYYLEVSRGQSKLMPATFERKQTLANSERFTTPELKEFEAKVLLAEERRNALERELFNNLQKEIAKEKEPLFELAESAALIDTLSSLAETAFTHNYICPTLDDNERIEIIGGRHPVLETLLSKNHFIPNDLACDEKKRLLLITGPNMAGKSTYLRQVALLVILAQMGSFVPAQSMHLGLVDKIFSRIGANDDLIRGHSTFMVEMSETANILNNATHRSLVLLDEIGRGTSTYDGLAIAWSVAEYLLRLRTKTLFATHYFELTELEKRYKEAINYHATAKEIDGEIVFLYKIAKGPASRSYGIQVAKLAGLPLSVIVRAKEILHLLEEKKAKSDEEKKRNEKDDQLLLFSI